tara:strand:+ start:383 stop:1162 length:780 start_codon:yes stop_codon:yes gene_type:complete
MIQNKSQFTKKLDLIRNLIIIIVTIYISTLIWDWNWIVTIICFIPVYVILMNVVGFITLPLYAMAIKDKEVEQVVNVDDKILKTINKYKSNIQERKIKKSKKKEFSSVEYSEENFDDAIKHTKNLTENNKNYADSYCKSYKTLEYSKSSIELAIYYLLDSIKFDKNCSIYEESKFSNELRELHMGMLMTYINVEFEEIPKNITEQIGFNSERKINIGKNQIEITKLIKWRSKDQWKYYLNAFGEGSDLGKICIEKITLI